MGAVAGAAKSAKSALSPEVVSRGIDQMKNKWGDSYATGNKVRAHDCSSWAAEVVSNMGFSMLKYPTTYTMAGMGTEVTKGRLASKATGMTRQELAKVIPSLQVGDLVFFNTQQGAPNAIRHVGVYIGGGKFKHLSGAVVDKSKGVLSRADTRDPRGRANAGTIKVNSLSDDYWLRRIRTVRRLPTKTAKGS